MGRSHIMKKTHKILLLSLLSIAVFSSVLFLGLSLSDTSHDANIALTIAAIMSIFPLLYMFTPVKSLNIISFLKICMVGVIVLILDYLIYYLIVMYIIFAKGSL